MATPQMAFDECDIPLNAVINVLANGTVAGRTHRFIFDQGTIQFVSAYPTALVATFSPVGVFGDPVTGEVEIPATGSTAELKPGQQNVCVNYQISGDSINTTPANSISVGCAPLTIMIDGEGGLSISDSCIPNGGAISFVGAADVPRPGLTLSFTSNDPGKGSPLGKPITVKAGKTHSLHAINTDVTVTISVDGSDKESNGGTIKIGSGGGGPIK
jgi:hypothetical protein